MTCKQINDDVAVTLLIVLMATAVAVPACSSIYNWTNTEVVDRGTIVRMERNSRGEHSITIDTNKTYRVDSTLYHDLLVGDLVVVHAIWPDWEGFSHHNMERVARS